MDPTASKSSGEAGRTTCSPPRSAYIHVPFCRHRCGYCNFTLVAGRDDLIGDYLRAIELELAQLETPREVDTLYFGGGTPTQLSPDQLLQLGRTVMNWHPLAAGYEWTVEANPADVTERMVETLCELGVTRLSLGGQSFRDEKLRLLERDHSGRDVVRAVELARGAGLHVALDLIFATPGETLDEWLADVEAAIALGPDHVSTYGLTFERGTAFWSRRLRGEILAADEELEREMYAAVIDRLADVGFEHYEVSNFARPVAARGTTRRIGRATVTMRQAPGRRGTSTVFAKRITAARRRICGACLPASRRWPSESGLSPRPGRGNCWCSRCGGSRGCRGVSSRRRPVTRSRS